VATLGAFDPELRREALFDPTLVAEGWFDPELIDAAGAAGLTMAPAGTASSEQTGAGSWSVGAVAFAPAGALSTERAAAGTLAPPPTDVAVTILDYATLGPINGASGGSMSGHLLYAVNTGRWWFFTYGTVLASGTATGGTNQTLVDSGAAFTTALNGRSVVIVAGTGAGNAFEVTRTSATTLRLQNNGDPATAATLTFTPDGTSQYRVVDSRTIRAYVSSSSDLSTATWAAATGSASADMTNGVGVDMAGGRFDGGAFGGIYPTDGRQLAMAYASVSGHDIAYAIAQVGIHWFKISNRARITAASTIAWDNNSSNTNPWDDGFGGEEALPYSTQPLVLAFDSNNSRWHVIWNKTQGMAGAAWTSNENGTLTQSPTWGGYIQTDTYDSSTDNNSTHFPYQAGLAELASGIMLAVYCFGNAPTSFSTTVETQTGLRFTKSSSATAWPTVNTTGAAVPSLSATANSPNDWSMVQRTTTDVHIIRRNSATVLEHIRYDGTTWGSVTTLSTSGLTGHVSNSGIGLATDGMTVWCVVLDSDANNSIKYLTWTAAGGWASSWTTLSTNNNVKAFVTVHQRVGNNQIGVAWTEGPDGSGRYAVRGAAISATVALTISPAGSASDERSSSLTGQVGAVSLAPGVAGSSERNGALSAQSIAAAAPAGAPSQEAAGSLAATTTASLSPAGAPSAERAGAATATSAAIISPAGSPTTEAVGPAALTSTVSLAPSGAPTSERNAAGALGLAAAIAPAGTPTQETAGVAVAVPGATTIAMAGAKSSEQSGAGAFVIGAAPQTMAPAGAPSSEAASAFAGVPGAVTASPAGARSTEQAGAGALTSGPAPQTMAPVGAPSAERAGPAAFSGFVALQPAAPVSEERVAPAQLTAGFVVIAPAGARSTEQVGAGSLITFTQTAPWYRVPTAAPFIGTGVLAAANVGTGQVGATNLGAGLTSSTNLGTGQLVAANVGAPSGGQTTAPNLGDGTTGALNAGTGQTRGDYLEKPGG
jgi:hypothetical protein